MRQADAHALLEEFRGVLGAPAGGALTETEYQALGVRQSLYPTGDAGAAVHDLFEKYLAWLKEEKLFDLNLVAHAWRAKAEPRYDFVVVDEVQDFTNAELALILDTLKAKDHFLLCGDSHQIVHPNFFSWASVRALFWRTAEADKDVSAAREISVLQTNFRNTQAVTGLANRLLKAKQARFGSVDRESNFLVRCASVAPGAAQLLKGEDKALRALDALSRACKQEQARAIRETFLAARPTPWTPWSLQVMREWTPKALDPKNPSAKTKQALLDYALWHGQGAYVERLAQASFAPALTLTHRGQLLAPIAHTFHDGKYVDLAKISGSRKIPATPWAAQRARRPRCAIDSCGRISNDPQRQCCRTAISTASTIRPIAEPPR